MMKEAQRILTEIDDLKYLFEGQRAKASFEELPPHYLSINKRIGFISYTYKNSSSDIMQTKKERYNIVNEQIALIFKRIKKLL